MWKTREEKENYTGIGADADDDDDGDDECGQMHNTLPATTLFVLCGCCLHLLLVGHGSDLSRSDDTFVQLVSCLHHMSEGARSLR